jgi:hypothetical protein
MVLSAKGLDGQLTLDGDWLTISRKGGLAKLGHGLAGEKRVLVTNITAVRLKAAGLTSGYLQISMMGSVDARKGGVLEAGRDENSVTFSKRQQGAFEAIRSQLEERMSSGVGGPSSVAQPTSDLADQLRKLAGLRDEGILSEEEFAAQKAKLLNS